MPQHAVLGRSAGLNDAKLRHLADEPLPDGVYTEVETAIIRYARTSTVSVQIDDGLFAELERHLNLHEIMVLWAQVGLANMINRFHATFHTDVNQEILDAAASCPIVVPRAPGG